MTRRTISRGVCLDRDGCRGQDRVLDVAQGPYPTVALKASEITIGTVAHCYGIITKMSRSGIGITKVMPSRGIPIGMAGSTPLNMGIKVVCRKSRIVVMTGLA